MEPTSMDNRQVSTSLRSPSRDEMHAVFEMCRKNQWTSVLNCVRSNPSIAVTSMIMDNHISTTILHQAITSKGETKARARVILEILATAPRAASIKNGYGSLPLHVIAQRNTKMDAPTKELLITELVLAYKDALVAEGGVGKRTPLHIIFTDYISPRVTKLMIDNGRDACFKRDKKGYLPIHVACSRHCSPEKLLMLLEVNPDSLFATTNEGFTLLSLARSTATKSHPNYALIEELKRKHEQSPAPPPARVVSNDAGTSNGEEVDGDDVYFTISNKRTAVFQAGHGLLETPTPSKRRKYRRGNNWKSPQVQPQNGRIDSGRGGSRNATPIVGGTTAGVIRGSMITPISTPSSVPSSARKGSGSSRGRPKRKVTADYDGDNSPAHLLLHFSRQTQDLTDAGVRHGSYSCGSGFSSGHFNYHYHRHSTAAESTRDVSEYFAEV